MAAVTTDSAAAVAAKRATSAEEILKLPLKIKALKKLARKVKKAK